jgi:pyrophosphate--fructose-6-phosphate 1-phosphotransferase
MPEMRSLIEGINRAIGHNQNVPEALSAADKQLFSTLPPMIQTSLVSERDPHGNIQVSQIATDELLIALVQKKLTKLSPFVGHFFGYEGRCCFPTNFDAHLGYALGRLAYVAIREKLTGFICGVQNLTRSTLEWSCTMVPIVSLMHFEERLGKSKAVIKKTVIDTKGRSFVNFSSHRELWALEDRYISPGPIQFFGPKEVTDAAPLILR